MKAIMSWAVLGLAGIALSVACSSCTTKYIGAADLMRIEIRGTQAMPIAFNLSGAGQEMNGWARGGRLDGSITMPRQDYIEARRFLLNLCKEHEAEQHLESVDTEEAQQRLQAIIRVGRLGYYVGFYDSSETLEERASELVRWKLLVEPGLYRAFELGFLLSGGPITEKQRLSMSGNSERR